jgi:RNA polymerase sigma-70 factor (ECF subfamily)
MTARFEIVTGRASIAESERTGSGEMLDEATFRALYADAAAPLHRYIARTLGNRSIADDLLQETFLRLLRRPVPTTDLEDLRRYAFRIASHLIVDHHRARRRERSSNDRREEAGAHEEPALRLDVARQFARLSLHDRTLLWLGHVEGASHREMATMLGLRAASIRVLLSRARKRLARLLEDAAHIGEAR